MMIKYNSSLTVVDLLRSGVDAESAQMLREVGVTQRVMLCGIRSDQMDADMAGSGLGDADGILLGSDLTNSRHLMTLSLDHNQLGVMAARSIGKAVAGSGCIRSVSLRGNQLTDAGGLAIGDGVAQNKTLTNLDLRENAIAGSGSAVVAAAVLGSVSLQTFAEIPLQQLRSGQLESLELKGRALGPTEMRVLAALFSDNSSTVELDLSGNALCNVLKTGEGKYTAEGIGEFSKALEVNRSITSLNLKDNSLCGSKFKTNERNHQGAQFLAEALRHNRTLTEIKLDSNQFGDVGWKAMFEALRDAPENKFVVWDIASHGITNGVCESIAEYLRTTQTLRTLNLRANNIGAVGAIAIAEALPVNTSLTALDLRLNMLTDAADKKVVQAALDSPHLISFGEVPIRELRNDTITELNLKGKSLGPAEGRVLAGLLGSGNATSGDVSLGNKSVTMLDVGANSLTEPVLLHLVNTVQLHDRIKVLALEESSMPVSVVRCLTEYIKVTGSLTDLKLAGNPLSTDSVKALKAANANRATKISIEA